MDRVYCEKCGTELVYGNHLIPTCVADETRALKLQVSAQTKEDFRLREKIDVLDQRLEDANRQVAALNETVRGLKEKDDVISREYLKTDRELQDANRQVGELTDILVKGLACLDLHGGSNKELNAKWVAQARALDARLDVTEKPKCAPGCCKRPAEVGLCCLCECHEGDGSVEKALKPMVDLIGDVKKREGPSPNTLPNCMGNRLDPIPVIGRCPGCDSTIHPGDCETR